MQSLRQFSKLAGVSAATVSRVFSSPEVVARDTCERILELAQSVGFRPSAVSKAAFGGKTRSIGVLLPVLNVSYFADIASSLQQALLTDDYLPMVLEKDTNGERRAVRRLIDHRVDALVINLIDEGLTPDDFAEMLRAKLPTVLLGPIHANLPADIVANDDVRGGILTGEHLAALGHRHFGFCYFGSGHSASDLRLVGFRQAITRHAGQLPDNCITTLPTGLADPEAGDAAVADQLTRILSRPDRPTAIFASTDILAGIVYKVARQLGLKIPADLSVVGYANLTFSGLVDPPMTTIDQNGREIGRRAAELVLSRLKNPLMPRQSIVVPVQFVDRQSTAPPR